MKTSKNKISMSFKIIATVLLLYGIANADNVLKLILSSDAQLQGIDFSVKAGILRHDGKLHLLDGALNMGNDRKAQPSRFEFPIAAMTTGDDTRDCHMREALGLNYDLSDFPEKHICDSNHELPKDGKNSIQFPTIAFDIQSIKLAADPTKDVIFDSQMSATSAIANVAWTVHGVTVAAQIPITITPVEPQRTTYQFVGATRLSLADFKVQVKPFGPVKVDDKVKVSVNVELIPTLVAQ